MRCQLVFALLSGLLLLTTSSSVAIDSVPPTDGVPDLDPAAVVPLDVLPADDLVPECLAAVAAETSLRRAERLEGAMSYVRTVYPDLDDAGRLESAQILLAERCRLQFETIPAYKELLDGRWVAHFGEHSIVHDLWQNGAEGGTVPISLVFFGTESLNGGSTIKQSIESSGWQEPGFWGFCEGGEQETHLYDKRHGASADSYVNNQWHLQKVEDEGCGDERHHLHLWPSQTGDNHPGTTNGGYVIANGHYEIADPDHEPVCYDCARNYVTKDVLTSGVVDAVYKVPVGNGKWMPQEPNPDGMVYYLHMKTPARPCPTSATSNAFPVVRVFEHAGYLGQCRGFNTDDPDLTNNFFANGLSVNDATSSAIVTQGFRAVFYEHVATTNVPAMGHNYHLAGAQRWSPCSDNQFVNGGFNDRASALQIQKVYLVNCYGSFSNVRGSANYVEATLTSSWQPQAMQVRAYVNNAWSGWTSMTKQVSGAWTATPYAPQGASVQLRAIVGTGGGADLSACYNWIPAPNTPATTAYCPDPFKATFSGVSGNDWWVQTNVNSRSDMPVAEVWARVNCVSPGTQLTNQGWGWAASFYIAPGSKVDFYAMSESYSPDGAYRRLAEVDVSKAYTWPTAAETTPC